MRKNGFLLLNKGSRIFKMGKKVFNTLKGDLGEGSN
jgi:hypothetical protein